MDNHHVNITGSSISCGVIELSRIESDSKKVLYALASYLYHPSKGTPAVFVIWSDLRESNGTSLAKEIEKYFSKYGRMYATEFAENPKTSNEICVWFWEIPHKEFKEWYVTERIERAKKV